MRKLILAKWVLLVSISLLMALSGVIYVATFHPDAVHVEPVISPNNGPVLRPGQKLKILSWNIQYLAGKNYVFFYDLPGNNGPDERPLAKDIAVTLHEVKKIIVAENPDIILLQEVDDGSKRTDYGNQLQMLLDILPKEYSSSVASFYHKAKFLPHSRIMGSVGLKLAVISKYKISTALRHQLPIPDDNFFVRQFNFKRCVLEVRTPIAGRKDFVLFNTHLDAFSQGNDLMKKQVDFLQNLVGGATREGFDWVLGGDFNLLAPGKSYSLLKKSQQSYYNDTTELAPMFLKYRSIPDIADINGSDYKKWLTHFPNDPEIGEPDRTIDFIFLSERTGITKKYIRQNDTLKISDHLPVIAELRIL